MKKKNLVILAIAAALVMSGCTASSGDAEGAQGTVGQVVADVSDKHDTAQKTPVETPAPALTQGVTDPREVIGMELTADNWLAVGENGLVKVELVPATAISDVEFSSSDDSVISVDAQGRLKANKLGSVTITGVANNGVTATVEVSCESDRGELTYEKTADGTGYRITSCGGDMAEFVYRVTIPAEYEGLPVKEIADKAFINCTNLLSFAVEEGQQYFAVIDDVLFDKSLKTLVRFPNGYCSLGNNYSRTSYQLPEGTESIGDYAFAGLQRLDAIHIPEGVTAMGNCVFTEHSWQVSVYCPDSLVNIGENITLNQRSNLAFFASKDSYVTEYASARYIPCGYYWDYKPEETTVEYVTIVSETGTDYKAPEQNRVIEIPVRNYSASINNFATIKSVNIAEYQNGSYDEVRLMFEECWKTIIPDKNGGFISDYPAMTGVYGIGYTSESATLVGYDFDGKVTGTMKVEGNFAYSFPGAINLSVAGGKDTNVIAVPYEPKFVASPGKFRVEPEDLNKAPYGNNFQTYFFLFTGVNTSPVMPDYLNCVSQYSIDGEGFSSNNELDTEHYRKPTERYSLTMLECIDPLLVSELYNYVIECDRVATIYEEENFKCSAKEGYGLTEEYGKQAAGIYEKLKECMVGKYYPSEIKLNQVGICVNGNWPTSANSLIELDDYCLEINEGTASTLYHEMVHAIDQSTRNITIAPSAWMEGRAEYISELAQYGVVPSLDERTKYFDWSFMSEEEKADFYYYFCHSTNRYTDYSIGEIFFNYLVTNYGVTASAKIMKNLDELTGVPQYYWELSEEECDRLFKKCVTDATSDTIFDDFVRDVINK